MDINNLNENHELILILHLRGLRIHKTSFIYDIYISQIKVFLNKNLKFNIIDNYSIIDDDNDNDNYDNIFNEEIYNSKNDNLDKENIIVNINENKQEEIIEKNGTLYKWKNKKLHITTY